VPAGTPVVAGVGYPQRPGSAAQFVSSAVELGVGDGAGVVAGGVVAGAVVVVGGTVGDGDAEVLGDGEGVCVAVGLGVGLLDGEGDGATAATVNAQFTVPRPGLGQSFAGYTLVFADPAASTRSGMGLVFG